LVDAAVDATANRPQEAAMALEQTR